MRIDRLELQNFKKYKSLSLDLHPRFNLLVGDNGSGKTSILDGLAVAMGIWLVYPPDSIAQAQGRDILPSEIHLEARRAGDRIEYREFSPTTVTASGYLVESEQAHWTRKNDHGEMDESGADYAQERIQNIYARDLRGIPILLPILAYYGAGRAWAPSNARPRDTKPSLGPARRWAAFADSFSETIGSAKLQNWFKSETIAAGNNGGRPRPGFEVVKQAVLKCVPGADNIWFDGDLDQIVLSIEGNAQPFGNLSAGQVTMLAMVADIAIKAVTQNAFLLPREALGPEDDPLPQILHQTQGIVLIDELDVHLHPSWQRRVATDLKETFPGIQFICTSHSPQVIGEVPRDQVRVLRGDRVELPPVALGADSNWILDHVMLDDASSETPRARELEDAAEIALEEGDLDTARARLDELREMLDGETGHLVRLESSLYTLEALAQGEGEEGLPIEND